MLLSVLLALVLALALVVTAVDIVVSMTALPARAAVPAEPPITAWPGPSAAEPVDVPAFFKDGLSGLSYVVGSTPARDRIWGVHDAGRLYRLVPSGERWVADETQGWAGGKELAFPDGSSGPDVEGVVMAAGAAWVSVERDGARALRNSILRVPLGGDGTLLRASHEWDLGPFYPGVASNLGPESVAWVPNATLVGSGFWDEAAQAVYDPARYPAQMGGGLFLVVVEAPGPRDRVDAFVLSQGGGVTQVASFANPVGNTMALDHDASTGELWAVCDHFCDVRSARFTIGADGRYAARAHHRRPAGLPSYNFEGFAIAPTDRCVGGRRPVYWANDANDLGRALWRGHVDCPVAAPSEPTAPTPTAPTPTAPTPTAPTPTAPTPPVSQQPTPGVPSPTLPLPSASPAVPSPSAQPGAPPSAVPPTELPPVPAPAVRHTPPSTLSWAAAPFRAGRATRFEIRAPGASGGRVRLAIGRRTGTAAVVEGRARVTVPGFRTAGVRQWSLTWRGADGERRSARGRVPVLRATATLRPQRSRVTSRVGRAVVVRGRVQTGRVHAARSYAVSAAGERITVPVRGDRDGRWQLRIPGQHPVLQKRGVRTLRITYRGGRHSATASARVRLRLV